MKYTYKFIPDVFDEIYIMRDDFECVDNEKNYYDGIWKVHFSITARSLSYISGPSAPLVR